MGLQQSRISRWRAQRRASTGIVGELERALRAQVLARDSSVTRVAELLAMHRRTLNRRLQREGTTFRAVLEQVRFDAARELLRDEGREIEEIARMLGYTEASAFTRAFRRWSGTTPGRWRTLG